MTRRYDTNAPERLRDEPSRPLPDNVARALAERCDGCPTRAEVAEAKGALRFAKYIAPGIYILTTVALGAWVQWRVSAEMDKRLGPPRPVVTGTLIPSANASEKE